jgi:hypothetical protein
MRGMLEQILMGHDNRIAERLSRQGSIQEEQVRDKDGISGKRLSIAGFVAASWYLRRVIARTYIVSMGLFSR